MYSYISLNSHCVVFLEEVSYIILADMQKFDVNIIVVIFSCLIIHYDFQCNVVVKELKEDKLDLKIISALHDYVANYSFLY